MFGTQSYGRRGLALLTSLLLILLQLAAPLGALATETADVPAVYVSYTDANGLTGSAMGQLAVGEDTWPRNYNTSSYVGPETLRNAIRK